MHNAFLNIDNKKMSKSLGNFFTVRDISEKYDLQVLRFFMLSAHYRSPLNFSAELMEAAKNGLSRIVTAVQRLSELETKAAEGAADQAVLDKITELQKKYEAAMEDDFNTADAISALFEMVKVANVEINENSSKTTVKAVLDIMNKFCYILGIITDRKEESLDAEVEELIAKRQEARKNKDFAKADEIRDQLLAMGIILKDTREGVKWERA